MIIISSIIIHIVIIIIVVYHHHRYHHHHHHYYYYYYYYYHVILCNFRSLFYFMYITVNSSYLNKPNEDWYWAVEMSQLNFIHGKLFDQSLQKSS